MNPDLGSGTGISYDAQFTLVMIQVDASRKTADQQVLLDKSAISPKTVSNGENTLPRIYKIKNSRDTKQLSREAFSSEKCLVYYLVLSAIFSLSVIFFSTPRGVRQNKKSPSHFTELSSPETTPE